MLKEAKISCKFTHNHKEAIKGAKAVAGCVFLARTGASKEQIKNFVQDKIGYNLNFTIESIRESYVFNSRANYSVPPAIMAFLQSTDYISALRKAISLGGDSDTIACITGGIAHAFYKKIPQNIHNKCMLILDSGLKKAINAFVSEFKVEF